MVATKSIKFPFLFPMVLMCSIMILSKAGNHQPEARTDDSSIKCIERERQALLQFKQGLEDDYGLLASWGRQGEGNREDCCQWRGVQCSKITGRVISLDLQASCDAFSGCKSLQGNISSSLLVLEHLNYLDLSGNDFYGNQIPSFIGSLVKLTYLNLSSCRVSGEIPHQFKYLSNLLSLDLSYNLDLSAKDFAWASNMSMLRTLNLQAVQLTHATDWFHAINSLPSLTYMNLDACSLPDPSPLSNVNSSSKSLAYINLGYNSLSSTSIYHWLFNISGSLVEVHISGNDLRGRIPKEFGKMKSLSFLDLSDNYLLGPIPGAFSNLTSLSYLDLSSNQLHSPIPEAIGSMTSLSYLDLSVNELQGRIPKALGNLTSLTHLDLSSNQLQGPLLEDFGSVTSLTLLDLSQNQLQGPIPETFGNMTSLSSLDLSYNQLKGSLPQAFGQMSSLLRLLLSENQLEGVIPNSFRHLCNLKELVLSKNNISGDLSSVQLSGCFELSIEALYLEFNSLSGPLPDFARFQSLQILYLSHNQLNGSLPSSFKQYSGLESLCLGHNQLTGSLPEDLGQLSMLQVLDVSSNSLSGTISEAHLSNLSGLVDLDLSFNNLQFNISPNWTPPFKLGILRLDSCKLGPYFPHWLQTTNNYVTFSISNAGIADTLPEWFWKIFKVGAVANISHNQICGTLPNSPFQRRGLKVVDLSFNCLEGRIPMFLTEVPYMDLSSDKFSGRISSWCPATNTALEYLDLSDNLFSGQLPDCWRNMSQLRVLNLRNNSFAGAIPSSFGNLALLEALDLASNKLSGEVPLSLKNCTSLRILDLSENFLSGEVPNWIGNDLLGLNVLILRRNEFVRSLPLEICHLSYIQVLDLSQNNISGTIPSCLYNLSDLSRRDNSSTSNHTLNTSQWTNFYAYADFGDLVYRYFISKVDIHAYLMWEGTTQEYWQNLALVRSIDLSSNELNGGIPVEISSLAALQSLNLSRNHLTGQITPKLGQLKFLESLDLSINQLSGEIPESLSELDFLSVLDLSYNNLSGKIPSGTQLQGFNESSYTGNPDLCGLPLQKKCEGDETEISHHKGQDTEEQEGDGFISRGWYISIGLGFLTGFWGACGVLLFKRSWRHTYFRFCNHLYDRLFVTVVLYIAQPIRRWQG